MGKKQLDITFYEDVVAQRAKTWLVEDINKAKTEGKLNTLKVRQLEKDLIDVGVRLIGQVYTASLVLRGFGNVDIAPEVGRFPDAVGEYLAAKATAPKEGLERLEKLYKENRKRKIEQRD